MDTAVWRLADDWITDQRTYTGWIVDSYIPSVKTLLKDTEPHVLLWFHPLVLLTLSLLDGCR